jgi:cell wall-associated NlpC family hydrolase
VSKSSAAKVAAAGVVAGLYVAGGVLVILIAAFSSAAGFLGSCGGPGGPAYRSAAGATNSADQMANARTITVTTATIGAPERAAVAALAAAMQESKLKNVHHGDRDSLGIFQQRANWASAAAREDVPTATKMFLTGGRRGGRGLLEVPGWKHMSINDAVQATQRSGTPDAYGKWVPRARAFANRYWPKHAPTSGDKAVLADYQPGKHSGPSTVGPGAGAIACPGKGGAPTGGPGTGQLPKGWKPPSNKQEATVVRFARAQLGKPYVYGAEGPKAFDCSGLTMKAWAAAGVVIPRTTSGQENTGTAVSSTAALKPGDLIFLPGSDGTAAQPRHVGLYIGHGALIDAPHTGTDVQIEQLSHWKSRIVRIRRPSGNTAVGSHA